MSAELVGATEPMKRDRWGRPLVVPQGGGKPVPYTRCTTFIDCIEDKYNLQKWMQRMVALGLAERDDLILSVAAHRDDKRELDRVCDAAKEAAKASSKATTGTAIHSLTELVDRGLEVPSVSAEAKADLAAYEAAVKPLKMEHIEAFTVLDTLKIGGTPDRIVKVGGETYIADLKTGSSIEWGTLKIAAQLAVYSRSWLYDHTTGERTPHGASTNRGIVIHLPAGSAQATLHWIDLAAGWEAVKVAKSVREQRAIKYKDLTEPFTGKPERPSLNAQKKDEARLEERDETLLTRIAEAPAEDDVRNLWGKYRDTWTEAHTEAAKARIHKLSSVNTDA